jgi:hypothetical protein
MKPKHIAYDPEFERRRWVENASKGLRVVPASDIGVIDHNGWYLDDECSETVEGAVLLLPHGRCVPAIADPWIRDAYLVDFHSVTDDKRDAARWADSMAQQFAEREREYQAGFRALSNAQDSLTELLAELCDCRAAHTEYMRKGAWELAERLRGNAHRLVAAIREYRETVAELSPKYG